MPNTNIQRRIVSAETIRGNTVPIHIQKSSYISRSLLSCKFCLHDIDVFQTINTVGQKGFDNKSMFCHRRKVGALFSYLITFVPISNIPITEGMNIILNKNTTAIIVVNYVDFQ